MTASTVSDADAAPTWDGKWNSIDWASCYREVRKLQVRIAKAVREGHWRKAKALQWLLTHSFSAKALAVRRVTENQGKRTPGVDKVVWSTPNAKADGIRSLQRKGYQPQPLRRIYIPKSNGKLRPLGIPTMTDRAMQALHLSALLPIAETTADWNSYGFRPERSTHDAIGQVFNVLNASSSAEWILEGDIKGCFDHISHDWMLRNIHTDTRVLEQWLKAGFIDKGKLFPTEEGTPQGGPISPTAANMVLDGLEHAVLNLFPRGKIRDAKPWATTREGRKAKLNFVRYADDFIITGSSRELLEEKVKPLVRQFLAERGLTLSEEKTRVTHISEGFDFLGWNVRKYRFGKKNAKLLIMPSKKNVKAFHQKLRETVRKFRAVKQEALIKALNPMIEGWAGYHRHIVAGKVFERVDHFLWWQLWRWAVRRHPTKNKQWVRKKYFGWHDGSSWAFKCRVEGENGWRDLTIKTCSKFAIERHVKIFAEANPFDPRFESYFEDRQTVRMAETLAGRRKIFSLWKKQDGLCPVCATRITKASRWHVHHMVRRIDGGDDSMSNLRLLHPACHRQHHANPGLKWKLPVELKDST